MSHAAVAFGARALLELAALLSLSLGLMNFLPVPLLDGGHLLFYAIEAVRGRALSRRAQEYALRGGLAFMLALAAFVTVNDIRSLLSI
jgi:regulator of sigma E protease